MDDLGLRPLLAEADAEVLDPQQAVLRRSSGSRSRGPVGLGLIDVLIGRFLLRAVVCRWRPSVVRESAKTTIARPGITSSHQAWVM